MSDVIEKTKPISDLFEGGRKCRLEWHISGRTGHGDWFHVDDKSMLEAHAVNGNRDYGAGTHLVKEADI